MIMIDVPEVFNRLQLKMFRMITGLKCILVNELTYFIKPTVKMFEASYR